MLKFTVNKNNLKEYEMKIITDKIFYSNDLIHIKTINAHSLQSGDFINIKRVDVNNNELFNERLFVNVIDKNTFSIDTFEDFSLSAVNCELIDVYSPLENKEISALKITFEESTKILTNRQNITNSTIPNEINTPTLKKRCVGDMVNFNNIFLLKAAKVENNQYIEYENILYNTEEKLIFRFNNISILINGLIPLTYNGTDNTYVVYWFFNEKENDCIDKLLKHYKEGVFTYKDTRFFNEIENKLFYRKDFSGNTDSYIYQTKNVLDVDFVVEEKFDVTLLKNDYYKDFYVEEKINENINSIVDMEKQIFIPKLEQLDSNCVVNSIKINVNVRKRNYGWNSTILDNSWYGEENGENTKISDIGFSEDDIKYQKNALKKSFLRLSFYDTPYRGNQKLLYYSTIFLDSNKIFNDYFAKQKKSDLEFIIKNSFDYFSCSEGYYLYLYPKLAKKDVPTTIYMKIEFNHAKYGKKISLVLPSDNDYKNGYIKNDNIGTKGIEKLFNDLYIKVNIMYDSKNNKYVWYIPDILNSHGDIVKKINDKDNKKITLTLYEPIINESN